MEMVMTAEFNLTRKTVMALVVIGLLSGTAMVGSMALLPPSDVQAESMKPIDPSMGFSQLVEHVMPSVVSVSVKIKNTSDTGESLDRDRIPPQFREFFEQFPQFRGPNQAPRGGMAQGSGFVISADGYVVTNNHVVDNAAEVSLRFQNGEEHDATVVGTDPKTDLALLKINTDKTFLAVEFSTADVKVGDWVMAVGNPFGLGGTVTSGIVSARGRDIGSGPYDDFIQIDASINRGNSGGPAFNLQGEVIGVNTAIFSPSGGSVGIGFAIPANIVKDVVESLKTSGSVTRGWLGVKIQPVTPELAEGLGLSRAEGAVISELTENSPALKAGLQQGDTILKAGGDDISDARDLAKTVAKLSPGKDVEFSIVRDGKPQTVTVTIGTLPGDTAKLDAAPAKTDVGGLADLGLEVAPAEDGQGVKVIGIKPDSVAGQRGVRVGDIILEVGGKEVNTPADVQTALSNGSNKKVLMLLKSGDGQRFVAIPREKS
jgi:serine protease Do